MPSSFIHQRLVMAWSKRHMSAIFRWWKWLSPQKQLFNICLVPLLRPLLQPMSKRWTITAGLRRLIMTCRRKLIQFYRLSCDTGCAIGTFHLRAKSACQMLEDTVTIGCICVFSHATLSFSFRTVATDTRCTCIVPEVDQHMQIIQRLALQSQSCMRQVRLKSQWHQRHHHVGPSG